MPAAMTGKARNGATHADDFALSKNDGWGSSTRSECLFVRRVTATRSPTNTTAEITSSSVRGTPLSSAQLDQSDAR